MTIMGLWTVSELKDLLTAKDYELGQLKASYDAFAPTWQVQDLQTFNAWLADYQAMLNRYAAAKTKAVNRINSTANSSISPDMIPAQDSYNGILRALQQKEGTTTPGDKLDLIIRLEKASGKKIDTSKEPQPKKGSDYDLNVYNNAKKAELGLIGAIILGLVGYAWISKPRVTVRVNNGKR